MHQQGFVKWCEVRVEDSVKQWGKKKSNKKEENEKNKGMVVILYIGGISEKLARINKKEEILHLP